MAFQQGELAATAAAVAELAHGDPVVGDNRGVIIPLLNGSESESGIAKKGRKHNTSRKHHPICQLRPGGLMDSKITT